MLRRLLVYMLAAGAGLALLSDRAMAAPVFPPGMRIGLEPAAGLTLSRRFPGFEDAERHVAVNILELPAAAYNELMRSATAKDQQGLTGVQRESFTFASGVGLLVSGAAQDNGVAVHRWFLVASAAPEAVPNLAMLLRVEVPEPARAVYTDAAVRQMLASVAFRRVPLQELLGLLPFKLTAMAGFRVAKVMPGGVVVTDGTGEDPGKQPYAIVTVGRGAPDEPADRNRFARDMLVTTPLRDLKVTLAEPMRINGRQGHEIRAEAIGVDGTPIALVQWLRFGGGGGFLRIVGVARRQDWDAVFNRFRALRDGVALK
jgi:hypothetical protein